MKLLKLALITLVVCSAGCAKKKAETLNLRMLESKKVAVAEITGDEKSAKMVEIALVNEIIEQGRFQIVDRTTVKEALVTYPAENDRVRLGKKVGADYVLSVAIQEFKVTDRSGLDQVEEEDSQMTEEWKSSDPIKTKSYVKVKGREGIVRLMFKFLDVEKDEVIFKGIGSGRETVNSREQTIPGQLKLLEGLSNRAVRDFFDRLPK